MVAIKEIFDESFETYGSLQIKVELEKHGFKVSRPKAARMIKAKGLVARRKRKWNNTTGFQS